MSPLASASVAAIRLSRSVSSVASKFSSTLERKILESAIPPMASPSTVQIVAARMRRAERELSRRPMLGARIFQAIAKATHRLNQVGVQFAAEPTHEHFDCIRVAVEVLIVKMLDEFGSRDDLALVMGQIREQTVLERGELYGISSEGHTARFRVDAQRSDFDVGGCDPGRPAEQSANAREKFFGIEGLGEVVVGACIEPCDLVAPAIACRQYQDRHFAARLPPLLEHAHAVDLRQPEI